MIIILLKESLISEYVYDVMSVIKVFESIKSRLEISDLSQYKITIRRFTICDYEPRSKYKKKLQDMVVSSGDYKLIAQFAISVPLAETEMLIKYLEQKGKSEAADVVRDVLAEKSNQASQ